MYLSKFTDYSFRVLIYLGSHQNELFTIYELSDILNLSTNHLKKIIHKLAKNGYIVSSKGRNGGIKLIMNPQDINLGTILEITEEKLNILECFSSENNTCNLVKSCKLNPVINDALSSFKLKFSEYTLE